MGEIFGADLALEQTTCVNMRGDLEINSICHDVLTADHECSYQALGILLLPSIWGFVAFEVTFIETHPAEAVVFYLFPSFPIEIGRWEKPDVSI